MNIDESYLTYHAGEPSEHFDGTQFFNPWSKRPKKGFFDMLKWRFNGQRADWPLSVENEPRPPIPPISEKLRVTYIGHATMLAQIAGKNILIDPVFSQRCSPFSSLGPKRVRQPFVTWDKLPKIDYVFVSHNHYDHLDQPSLAWLARNHKPVFITPLGNTRLIKPCADGCSMIALDWHQSTPLGEGLMLTLTPAQHWSRRSFNDINRDLWGGFFLKKENGESLYYSGDSGFSKTLFENLHARYGAPDIALVPIGAYEPRWFMEYSHMNPDEAIQVLKIMKAKKGMGFHFETFQLTDEAFELPRKHTEEAMAKYGVREDDFVIPVPGDIVSV